MVILVINMTDQRDEPSNERFRSNLKRELHTMERRRAYLSSARVGRAAVLYFGPLVGGIVVMAGLMAFLVNLGIMQLNLLLILSFIVMVAGSFIVVGSIFAARVVMTEEIVNRE